MAKICGIMGDTGYGKSISPVVPPDGVLKEDEYNGINPSTTCIFNLDKKELPYANYINNFPVWKKIFGDFLKKNVLKPNDEELIPWIEAATKKPEINTIIIDTFSLGMFRHRMKTEEQKGYEKWNNLNVKFWKLLENIQENKRDDLIVWIFFHIEEGKDREGNTVYHAKMEGNLLTKIPEKIITNMFFATKDGDNYVFETQANGTTAKNPPLLFDNKIPNSLKLIEDTLRGIKNYRNIK
mgnify:CR=1 FL=1